jgi:hypothetical protein
MRYKFEFVKRKVDLVIKNGADYHSHLGTKRGGMAGKKVKEKRGPKQIKKL